MTIVRITAGINKTEYARKMDAQIGFSDALQRTFRRRCPAIFDFVFGSAKRSCTAKVQ